MPYRYAYRPLHALKKLKITNETDHDTHLLLEDMLMRGSMRPLKKTNN